jgi:hypothetical protein
MAFATHDIALLASEPQTLERSTMAINFDQIAGNEETSLLAFATYHPYQGLVQGQNFTPRNLSETGLSPLFLTANGVRTDSQNARNIWRPTAPNGLCR